jgi:starch synthase
MLLHPSRYEPCGLSPIYALRYGTLPIVRSCGGMADSVVDASSEALQARQATGFAFADCSVTALVQCARRALELYRQPIAWRMMQMTAMRQDFGWSRSAKSYAKLYRELVGTPKTAEPIQSARKLNRRAG